MYNHKAFGQKLKESRTAKNLSQKDLSTKIETLAIKMGTPELKVSQNYISELEKGVNNAIGLDRLSIIALALDTTMDNLLADSINTIYYDKDDANNHISKQLSTYSLNKLDNLIKYIEYLSNYNKIVIEKQKN